MQALEARPPLLVGAAHHRVLPGVHVVERQQPVLPRVARVWGELQGAAVGGDGLANGAYVTLRGNACVRADGEVWGVDGMDGMGMCAKQDMCANQNISWCQVATLTASSQGG